MVLNTAFGAIGGLNLKSCSRGGLTGRGGVNSVSLRQRLRLVLNTIGSYTNPNTTGSRAANNNWWTSFNSLIPYDLFIGET